MALNFVAINFGYKYFCFVIYFSNIFLSKLFSKIFFQHFFPKFFFNIFFQNFFLTFFSQNCCFKIFFPNIFFELFKKIFFFEGLFLVASPFIETKQTLCICVMKNMIYSKRQNWTLGSCDKVLFFDLYCLHHTRREKCC